MNEYLKILYLLVAGQGFFIFLFLFSRKNVPLRIFTSLLLIATFEIFMQYLFRTPGWEQFKFLIAFRNSLSFLYGVLFYLYIRSLHESGFRICGRCFLHLVPAAVFLFIDTASIVKGAFILPENFVSAYAYRRVFYLTLFISSITYLSAAFKLVMKNRRTAESADGAGTERQSWQTVILIYCFSLFAFLTIATVLYILHSPYSNIAANIYCLYLIIPIYATAFMIIFKYSFFSSIHGYADSDPDYSDAQPAAAEKYLRTKLDEETLEEYHRRIKSFIIAGQGYLDPELSVPAVADECGIPLHHVSQTINTKYGKSFHLLMMELRVRHSERLLSDADSREKSIIEIAFDSGFNSKSNFNMAFKKIHGITPTEFRKKTATRGGVELAGAQQA